MNIITISFENESGLNIQINPWFLLVILVFIALIFIIKLLCNRQFHLWFGSVEIDETCLGIGSNSIKIKCNKKNVEIAYKIWSEISLRKIGMEIDPNDDVVAEVYNSWYEFFKIARNAISEIPASQISKNKDLINVVTNVLNQCLRPHLTKYQARFRKWYDEKLQDPSSVGKEPQEIQKDYPQFNDLISDMIETNHKIILLNQFLEKMVFAK